MTRPALNQPTPAALTDAPRPPRLTAKNDRGGARVSHSESQRATPTTVGALSLELPKEALEVRTRFPVQPSCSSLWRASPDQLPAIALFGSVLTDPPARCLLGGSSSYSPPDASNGHVPTWQTRGNETSHSCDGGTSRVRSSVGRALGRRFKSGRTLQDTRGPASLTQRLLHAASGPSLGSGLVGAATFFGGA